MTGSPLKFYFQIPCVFPVRLVSFALLIGFLQLFAMLSSVIIVSFRPRSRPSSISLILQQGSTPSPTPRLTSLDHYSSLGDGVVMHQLL